MLQFKSWARSDVEHLTVQKCTEWVNDKLLKDWTLDQLKCICIKSVPVTQLTVRRWMRDAGFKYAAHKKCYYVDRHEDPDVVADRNQYIPACFKSEMRQHVWVQMPLEQYKCALDKKNRSGKKRDQSGKVRKKKKKKARSDDENNKSIEHFYDSLTYHYQPKETGIDMVEVHVDVAYSYTDEDNLNEFLPKLPAEGGWLSTRMFPCICPLCEIGQDEVVFHPNTMNEMAWTIDDVSPLRSKGGTGGGKMISGFKSRVFGFGLKMSEEELEEVNSKRRRGKTYTSYAKEAATFLTGTAEKKEFKESPFVRMITYGNAQDGYWGSNHMLIQVQDVLDVWNTLECTSYMKPICEFDHSSGHDCERDDGLTVSPTHLKMNWGKGRMMRNCELTAGCLGTIVHDDRVYESSTYSHQYAAGNPPKFLEGNEVPPEFDEILEANCIQRKKRKDELVQDLEAAGYNGKGGVVDLKARCVDAGIPTMKTEDRIKPGYVNKRKGAYDIAYELGWIDANKRNSEGISCLGKEQSSGSQQQEHHHQINRRNTAAAEPSRRNSAT